MNCCLSNQAIDVRYVFTGDADVEDYLSLVRQLPPDEQLRAEQYLFLKDRIAFAVGRVLVRRMLSKYVEKAPKDWQFSQNSHGKPEIVRSSESPNLRFNLSHCSGIVVSAFSTERDIGVDVEHTQAKIDFLDIVRSQFSPIEIEALESLSGENQRRTFLALWTLKESYTKARGLGLSTSLSDFAFSLNPPTISFLADSPDDPSNWFFQQTNPSSSYVLAVAAHRPPNEEVDCVMTQIDLVDLLSPSLEE